MPLELKLLVAALAVMFLTGFVLNRFLNTAGVVYSILGLAAVMGIAYMAGFSHTGDHELKLNKPQAIPTVTKPNMASVSLSGNDEWSRHYYQFDPLVPAGYFGPPCVPSKRSGRFVIESPERCKQELGRRLKRDPMLLSVMVQEFNLLPNNTSQAQFARLSRQERVRRRYQPKVMTVLDSMRNLRFVPLEGMYYTQGVDQSGRVYQVRKRMDPSRHIAMEGITPDGRLHRIKTDCGHQITSKVPIPRIRIKQPPRRFPPQVPPEVRPPPPPAVQIAKCPQQGICGTPTTGDEQNNRTSPGTTVGSPTRDRSEQVSERQQPKSGGDLSGTTTTSHGTGTGSPAGGVAGQSGADETTGQQGGSSVITAPPATAPTPPAIGNPCPTPDDCG